MKKLLITGASGFLGWNICRHAYHAYKDWEIYGTVFTHPVEIDNAKIFQLDLTDFIELKRIFNKVRPDAVIHTAAASRPDYCQGRPVETRKINVEASVNLAGLCADRNIPFAFTSTDLVFDGMHAPYKEEDPVNPVNHYGEQKVLAEEGILKAYPEAAVCRMPLMFGNPGPAASSFFQTMLSAMRNKEELHLFEDEFRTPVSGKTAAEGLIKMLNSAHGIIHMGGIERISRFNFGLLIAGVYGIKETRFIRSRQKDIATSAPRPPDLSLDSALAYSKGFKPLPLKDQLQELLAEELS